MSGLTRIEVKAIAKTKAPPKTKRRPSLQVHAMIVRDARSDSVSD
jgi:hypothetical protein